MTTEEFREARPVSFADRGETGAIDDDGPASATVETDVTAVLPLFACRKVIYQFLVIQMKQSAALRPLNIQTAKGEGAHTIMSDSLSGNRRDNDERLGEKSRLGVCFAVTPSVAI